jgi:hypothetical protein
MRPTIFSFCREQRIVFFHVAPVASGRAVSIGVVSTRERTTGSDRVPGRRAKRFGGRGLLPTMLILATLILGPLQAGNFPVALGLQSPSASLSRTLYELFAEGHAMVLTPWNWWIGRHVSFEYVRKPSDPCSYSSACLPPHEARSPELCRRSIPWKKLHRDVKPIQLVRVEFRWTRLRLWLL